VQDGLETDVDCGGPCDGLTVPKLCGTNKGCLDATDCQSGYCNSSYRCALRANGITCNITNQNASCLSGYCDNSGTCRACTGTADCGGAACNSGVCQ
jgi:hypothetical protein